MAGIDRTNSPTLPTAVPVVGAVLVGGAFFYFFSGPTAWLPAMFVAFRELASIVMLAVAAGGYGFLLVGRLRLADVSPGFRAVSAAAVGLWMLSTAMLLIGTFSAGLCCWWLFWVIIIVGVLLAGFFGRRHVLDFTLPRRVGSSTLLWIVLGACAGIWLAGACRPPGFIGMTDAYDVLEYHLQLPREFYNAGRITQLPHNVYSYYPLGVEMLMLLGMAILGGAYEGMYLAKMIHGLFGVLTVAALLTGWGGPKKSTGLVAACLIASTAAVLYLSWLAMVELAMICYLTLAVLWLRVWLAKPGGGLAVCIGLMLGASCCVKYLSVGFIVGPVLAVCLAAALVNRRRLWQLAVMAGLVGLVFCPWLIRNTVYTRNPVFPLATSVFGGGHWPEENQRRWRDGHGSEYKPPVPTPPGWQGPKRLSKLELFERNFLTNDRFGLVAMLLAAAAVLSMLIWREGFKTRPWEWAMLAILAAQLAVWIAFTHGMPWRFMAVGVVPITLLAAGGLRRLADAKFNIPTGRADASARLTTTRPPGRNLAGVLLAAALLVNLVSALTIYLEAAGKKYDVPPFEGGDIAKSLQYKRIADLPEGSRVLLLGDATGFFFPANTIYATTFDRHLLEDIAAAPDATMLDKLRERGVTHILVNWHEIWRLAGGYGFPGCLSGELLGHAQAGRQPTLEVLECLKKAGMEALCFFPTVPDAPRDDVTSWQPYKPPRNWPTWTLYALPNDQND
ncbi:MAG: hypothetical protein K8S55_01775 [Phycisphaerae bacterium]|nr:hypothetical protein [Phycisphaerae bacterium]